VHLMSFAQTTCCLSNGVYVVLNCGSNVNIYVSWHMDRIDELTLFLLNFKQIYFCKVGGSWGLFAKLLDFSGNLEHCPDLGIF